MTLTNAVSNQTRWLETLRLSGETFPNSNSLVEPAELAALGDSAALGELAALGDLAALGELG